jgi:hypothetical protein
MTVRVGWRSWRWKIEAPADVIVEPNTRAWGVYDPVRESASSASCRRDGGR